MTVSMFVLAEEGTAVSFKTATSYNRLNVDARRISMLHWVSVMVDIILA